MKETSITLENAGAGLAEWVARAQLEQTTFVVLDAAVPVARLVPMPMPGCTGADLARALAATHLSAEECREWVEDLRTSHALLSNPEDKWQ